MRTLRLLITFYKSFALASLCITIACCWIFVSNGIKTLAPIFWFKAFTLGVFFYFINHYKQKELYYYKNLGMSIKAIYFSIAVFELTLYILSLYLSHILK